MSFLEALKQFIAKGTLAEDGIKVIIFTVIITLLDDFIKFKKNKNRNIPDIRFDELGGIAMEKLLKEGLKSVSNISKDDEEAKKNIRYLISQYYNKQYLQKNPHIQQLNDDVKELLNQFSSFFPQVGKAKLTHHKTITISVDFEIEYFEDYSFSKNEPKKTRLKNIFFAIYEVLKIRKSIYYSDLITELKFKLGLHDHIEGQLPSEKQADRGNRAIVELTKELDEEDDTEAINPFDGEDTNEEEDNEYGELSTSEELKLLPIKLENSELHDSDILIGQTLSQFLNICTERQRIIFGMYLLKENAVTDDESVDEDYTKNFNDLASTFNICSQTMYNEINKAKKNLGFVIKKNNLDENQEQDLIRKLIDEFEKYFNKDGMK